MHSNTFTNTNTNSPTSLHWPVPRDLTTPSFNLLANNRPLPQTYVKQRVRIAV